MGSGVDVPTEAGATPNSHLPASTARTSCFNAFSLLLSLFLLLLDQPSVVWQRGTDIQAAYVQLLP